MPTFMGGGDMIKRVTLEGFRTNDLPYKFEAGTPAIADAVGLGAAVDYLSAIGMDAVATHAQVMISYALERFEEVPGVKAYVPRRERTGAVAAFTLEGSPPHHIPRILYASRGV